MPKLAKVVFYREADGSIPLLEWLEQITPKAQVKCLAKIKRLKNLGHELRRPEADYLRDGIYELRVGLEGINYRMLYFFHGNKAVVISHGLIKERVVPVKDINRAIERKKQFEQHPDWHIYQENQEK